MSWKKISDSARDVLLDRKRSGESVEDMSREVGMKAVTLDRRLREWAAMKAAGKKKLDRPHINFRRWDAAPVLDGRDTLVTGDMHMPYLDYDLAEKMLYVAETKLSEPRRLLIAGDMFNMDAFSPFPRLGTYRATLEEELSCARAFLNNVADIFDSVEVLLGNHEKRIIHWLNGELTSKDLERLLDVQNVTIHDLSHTLIDTPNGVWRVTHQKNYSRNAQTVGKHLAHKFRQHIITHHMHKMSMGFDDSGQSVIVDNGCLADPRLIDFANVVDTTYPAWNQGFCTLGNGSVTLYSKNRALTDWGAIIEGR